MNRIQSVDVFRAVAIIAIIAIHTTPFSHQYSPIGFALDLATIVNQISRFAVPLFFILSGYFWATKFKDDQALFEVSIKMAVRLYALFLAWSIIYLIPFDNLLVPSKEVIVNLIYSKISMLWNNPVGAFFNGTKWHLWFLNALLCALLITATLVRLNLKYTLALVAIVLYLIGLAGKAYSDTTIGFHSPYNLRNGPFFSTIFFVTGYFLQRKYQSRHWFLTGCITAILGILMHFTELTVLNKMWGISMKQDYVLGTYFLGLGVALIALSNKKWLRSTKLANIGKRTLGIYASHFIFVDIFMPIEQHYAGTLAWDLIYVLVVFVFSYLLTSGFSKFAVTRKLVE
jgi:surface polysaccharide O-acyltransferase-like enzyme